MYVCYSTGLLSIICMVSLPEAFGSNQRSPPPPADPPRVDPPRFTVFFACGVKKTSSFTVFRAIRRQGISSWRCYKTSVFTWFWAPGGARGGKIGILRSFQHRWPKHGPNIAPKMAGQHRPNLGQHRPNIGPTWCQDCLAGARLSGGSL